MASPQRGTPTYAVRNATSSSASSPGVGSSAYGSADDDWAHGRRISNIDYNTSSYQNQQHLAYADPDQVVYVEQLERDGGRRPQNADQRAPSKDSKKRPWIGYIIVIGCLAGFAYSLYITPGIIAPLAMNPLVGPTPDSLVASGAKVTCLINKGGEWWRLVSPMWLHAGVIHLVVNLNMLRQLGFDLERQAGKLKFTLIYVCGGVFSMVASAIFTPQSVTVGASGALFGLLGAYLAELITNCHLLSMREGCCAFVSLFFSIAINLAIGLVPFVDNFAHIGALLPAHRYRERQL